MAARPSLIKNSQFWGSLIRYWTIHFRVDDVQVARKHQRLVVEPGFVELASHPRKGGPETELLFQNPAGLDFGHFVDPGDLKMKTRSGLVYVGPETLDDPGLLGFDGVVGGAGQKGQDDQQGHDHNALASPFVAFEFLPDLGSHLVDVGRLAGSLIPVHRSNLVFSG